MVADLNSQSQKPFDRYSRCRRRPIRVRARRKAEDGPTGNCRQLPQNPQRFGEDTRQVQ